jgi:hypothetical protein
VACMFPLLRVSCATQVGLLRLRSSAGRRGSVLGFVNVVGGHHNCTGMMVKPSLCFRDFTAMDLL